MKFHLRKWRSKGGVSLECMEVMGYVGKSVYVYLADTRTKNEGQLREFMQYTRKISIEYGVPFLTEFGHTSFPEMLVDGMCATPQMSMEEPCSVLSQPSASLLVNDVGRFQRVVILGDVIQHRLFVHPVIRV